MQEVLIHFHPSKTNENAQVWLTAVLLQRPEWVTKLEKGRIEVSLSCLFDRLSVEVRGQAVDQSTDSRIFTVPEGILLDAMTGVFTGAQIVNWIGDSYKDFVEKTILTSDEEKRLKTGIVKKVCLVQK